MFQMYLNKNYLSSNKHSYDGNSRILQQVNRGLCSNSFEIFEILQALNLQRNFAVKFNVLLMV